MKSQQLSSLSHPHLYEALSRAGVGEIAQWSRSFIVLREDLGFFTSSHVVAHTCLYFQFQETWHSRLLLQAQTCIWYTYAHTGNTLVNENKNKSSERKGEKKEGFTWFIDCYVGNHLVLRTRGPTFRCQHHGQSQPCCWGLVSSLVLPPCGRAVCVCAASVSISENSFLSSLTFGQPEWTNTARPDTLQSSGMSSTLSKEKIWMAQCH